MSDQIAGTTSAETRGQTERRMRPVLWWASLGVAAVTLQTYVYLRWIFSDNFRRVGPGVDPVTTYDKVFAWILQPAFGLAALLATVWVIRGCVKERRITFDAKLYLGWISMIWMDHAANLIRPQMLFNSYYLNRGSWDEYIPGWISRNPQNLPAPFFIEFGTYLFMIVVTVLGCKLMQAVKRRRPAIGMVGLTVTAWFAMAAFIVVIEEFTTFRTGWCWWTGTVEHLTLWRNSTAPQPLTEVAAWAVTLTVTCVLRYRHVTRGTSFAETGIDRVKVSPRGRGAITTFAVIGACTAAMGFYGVVSAIVSLYDDEPPATTTIPSYMLNGLCGEGTGIACPGPRVPVLLPRTPVTANNLPS